MFSNPTQTIANPPYIFEDPQLACAFLTNTSLEQAGHARSADGSQNLPVDRLCSYFVGVNHQSLKVSSTR